MATFVLLMTLSAGDDHALPCRPTIACTADFVPPGSVEIEAGYLFRRVGGDVAQQSTPTLLKLTLFEWVQLQVGTNGYTRANSPVAMRFVDDLTVGAKMHLLDQSARRPSLAWSAALSIPTVAQQGYVQTYDALLTAYATKDAGRVHFDFNVGLNLWRLERPLLAQPWIALAASVELSARLTAMVEIYDFADASPVAPRDAGGLLAVALFVRPWLVFDFGCDVGLIPQQRSISAFAGVTLVPVHLWSAIEAPRARSPAPRD